MSLIRLEVKPLEQNLCGKSGFLYEKIPFYILDLVDKPSKSSLENVFKDPLLNEIYSEDYEVFWKRERPKWVMEVGYRQGVTDNKGLCAKEALNLLNIPCSSAKSGTLYFFFEDHKEIKNYANPLIQNVEVFAYDDFIKRNRFQHIEKVDDVVSESPTSKVEIISLDKNLDELMRLSEERCLALSSNEMKFLKEYFNKKEVTKDRKSRGLPKEPTDVELEILAQSWSEHCKHKIFKATIEYEEDLDGHKSLEGKPYLKELGSKKIKGVYQNLIQKSTKDIVEERGIKWAKSVFKDNAGIVSFENKVDLCFKVETHNSPSALDPYGGALTGILGVNRDILGAGLGSKPIGNTNVFCLGLPHRLNKSEKMRAPKGLLHPKLILEGVHRGVMDGGNKSGIPTVNGAIHFDRDYAGKPLVFCGTVGVMPKTLEDGRDTSLKEVQVGDRVFMVGGAIGKDGLHGATFSSLELNEDSPTSAVQIGDPLTQKRVTDFLLKARDLGLYSSLTDNGAGGLSSSVGEMAESTGGATIDLSKCPVKYQGLKAWELMISESQERMTFAVPPTKSDAFKALSKKYGVSATDIGFFHDRGVLEVFHLEELVAFLELPLIHDLLPPMNLKALWKGPRKRNEWWRGTEDSREKEFFEEGKILDILLKLLSAPNIVSKESWVRQYDHEVLGSTHLKPFVGKEGDGPSDSSSIWLYPHGGEDNSVLQIGCGLAPKLSLWDPYIMAQFAVDEAVRNVVAHGGDIDQCALLDNFCWPDPVESGSNPDGLLRCGDLVRACYGLYDITVRYGTPLVSGKDSMKNDFRGVNASGEPLKISVLPTLLVTAFSKTTLDHTVGSDFKNKGDLIYLLGGYGKGLAGSEVLEHFQFKDLKLQSDLESIPSIDPIKNKVLYRSIYKALGEGLFESCHDLSEGGLAVALVESAIGGRLGFILDEEDHTDLGSFINKLFGESPGRFVVSVSKENEKAFLSLFKKLPHSKLGQVHSGPQVIIKNGKREVVNQSLDKMIEAFKKGV
ncbi:MAG: phosphoribosylformylglycinamidine synthase [Halobacteriovoraceae bacterium]|nr:phosphoribosylformylglycinamidine synthase [Halobacteriovoraceae bacterium]